MATKKFLPPPLRAAKEDARSHSGYYAAHFWCKVRWFCQRQVQDGERERKMKNPLDFSIFRASVTDVEGNIAT